VSSEQAAVLAKSRIEGERMKGGEGKEWGVNRLLSSKEVTTFVLEGGGEAAFVGHMFGNTI
jgi:hypothetical protein